jgi:hypothetical protein
MMTTHKNILFVVPPLPAAAPPSDIAMTACARSNEKFCTGTHNSSHIIRMKTSAKRIVKREGVPLEPWNMSARDGRAERADRDVPVCGGTKVRVAKRKWTMVRTVGGSWSRMMRMARTSRRGQDERMVVATVSMLGL